MLDKERKSIGSFPDFSGHCITAPQDRNTCLAFPTACSPQFTPSASQLWCSQLWPSLFSLSPSCLPPDSSSIPSPSRSFSCYLSLYFPLFIITQITAIYPKPWPDFISWHQTSAVIFLSHIFNQETQLGMPVPASDCQVGIKTWPEARSSKPGGDLGWSFWDNFLYWASLFGSASGTIFWISPFKYISQA